MSIFVLIEYSLHSVLSVRSTRNSRVKILNTVSIIHYIHWTKRENHRKKKKKKGLDCVIENHHKASRQGYRHKARLDNHRHFLTPECIHNLNIVTKQCMYCMRYVVTYSKPLFLDSGHKDNWKFSEVIAGT